MSIKLCVLWITFLTYLFIADAQSKTNLIASKWLKKLAKSITNSQQYQVVFIIPDEKSGQQLRLENCIHTISKTFPSLSITLQGIMYSKTKYPTFEKNPRRVAIFILILDSNVEPFSSHLSTSTEFLNTLAKEKSRPKFLIIHLLKERCFSYKKLLKNLWEKRFLDVTVLEVMKFNYSTKGKDLYEMLNSQKEIAILHQYNPFKNVHNREKFGSKSQLFPDKTRNFYSYPLKFISRNSKLNQRLSWITDIIPESMNVTLNITSISRRDYTLGCLQSEYKGKITEVFESRAQFIDFPFFEDYGCGTIDDFFVTSRVVMLETINFVVPRIRNHRISIIATKKVIYTLLVLGFVMIVVQVLKSICKLDKRFWQPIHIVYIIMGMSLPLEPRNTRDRIIFGSILITNIIYSSYLFTVLADVAIDKGSELKLETISDLDKSGLQPVFDANLYKTLRQHELTHFENVRKKSKWYSDDYTELRCLEDVIKHRNVSCLMLRREICNLFPNIKEALNDIKIIEQSMVTGTYLWFFEPGSPYVDRINELLLYSMENGLLTKSTKRRPMKIVDRKRTVTKKLKYQLMSIMLIGCVVSLIAFVGEIVGGYFWKKKKNV